CAREGRDYGNIRGEFFDFW
nr:immunoglobulin heavy chain junction region [Macaca mulatta]MOV36577.1 immunoglobulin heavy chain junction region [Macaca mulatta]